MLGDAMGLGKTIQAISLLCHLHDTGSPVQPFLVLSPLSVVSNWCAELSKFAPSLSVVQYTGNKQEREEIRLLHGDGNATVRACPAAASHPDNRCSQPPHTDAPVPCSCHVVQLVYD